MSSTMAACGSDTSSDAASLGHDDVPTARDHHAPEGVMMARYLANGQDDPINTRMLLGWQARALGSHTVGSGRTPVTILPAPRNGVATGRVAVEAAAQIEHRRNPSPTATTRDSKPATG
ncbi:chromatin-remodelling complex, RSC SWI/SNF subunit Rsc7/Swp82 [Purpureocillium lavendulum]|uniref:Chromatin-remodelling complex, RSC SWI/SNF subunit Rsc7/Swp82 n=1 Tax=Purpureocillium lavendulum TaxID=1247861 RepID=A0AB34FJ31_9HYPO|nr:chromatin-remodelling complex, RSC SWI/SNF subunit Rsc7/Swp82 [Purpureocillium lavendulum]